MVALKAQDLYLRKLTLPLVCDLDFAYKYFIQYICVYIHMHIGWAQVTPSVTFANVTLSVFFSRATIGSHFLLLFILEIYLQDQRTIIILSTKYLNLKFLYFNIIHKMNYGSYNRQHSIFKKFGVCVCVCVCC